MHRRVLEPAAATALDSDSVISKISELNSEKEKKR